MQTCEVIESSAPIAFASAQATASTTRPSYQAEIELYAEDRHARQVTIDIAPKGSTPGEIWRRYVIYEKKDGVVCIHPNWDYRPDVDARFNYRNDPPPAVIALFNQQQHRAISLATSAAA